MGPLWASHAVFFYLEKEEYQFELGASTYVGSQISPNIPLKMTVAIVSALIDKSPLVPNSGRVAHVERGEKLWGLIFLIPYVSITSHV